MTRYCICRLNGIEAIRTSFVGSYSMVKHIVQELNQGNSKFIIIEINE